MRESRYRFTLIKDRVSVPAILQRYGIALKREGDHLRGQCLLQIGTGHGKTAFVAWEKGWMCHSCDRKGNVLDLVAAKETVDIHEAARLLYEWFDLGTVPVRSRSRPPIPAATGPPKKRHAENVPLQFRLRLNPHHPFGRQRDFAPGHCEYLGCGYSADEGAMAGRWVFPIHNLNGELVGYAGRLVDDAAITGRTPRWRFTRGIRKSLELYNLHRVLRGGFSDVVVVESYWGVLACVRAGVMNAVALMGRTLSDRQAELLAQFPAVTLVMDGDKPGRDASRQVSARLCELPNPPSVRTVPLSDGVQPDDLEPDGLRSLLLSDSTDPGEP